MNRGAVHVWPLRLPALIALAAACAFSSPAADLAEAQQQFLAGQYEDCIRWSQEALRTRRRNEQWHLLLSKSLLATGRYPEALAAITNAVAQYPVSLALRWQAREVLRCNGQTRAGDEMLNRMVGIVSGQPGVIRDAPGFVVIGQAALATGGDPKRVLDTLFEAAKTADPGCRDVYLASGELALAKHDYDLAAKRFAEGLKQLPNDPDLLCGLARAYAPHDTEQMLAHAAATLEHNTNHVATLLLLADHQIDAENYSAAATLLDRVRSINPADPDAAAYRAVIAHLQNQPEAEQAARQAALKFWPDNPRVDYLIGWKLSQKYRFAEGAARQRQALMFDPNYLPAKAQLAQDLLRLGDEQGWNLVQEVQRRDSYDVQAYNLATLHDHLARFATLTNRHFVLRMHPHEAALYGPAALDLLERARSNLCAKYGVELDRPVTVEVFPEQKDFAVRTFGLPGNPGYLGVCFGPVITANSPAANPGHPVNWQAVLWHEFGHVVTLHLTRNKMPRWLSEGISVYEEVQANPAWGQRMNPEYRDKILQDGLTPVSRLSAAFLNPASDEDLQFAYYQSSLVVEFLVQRHGLAALKAVLRDLAGGAYINEAIPRHTAPMDRFDKEFAAFARQRAGQLAPGLDWDKPPFLARNDGAPFALDRSTRRPPGPGPVLRPGADEDAWADWAKTRPTNFWVLTRRARQLVEARNWTEAKPVLQRLLELYPGFTGPQSPYRMLAQAHRALEETESERRVLARFAELDGEAPDAYLRLAELAVEQKDWPAVILNANRYLAVNPLVASPYQRLAQAAEETDDTPLAVTAWRAVLELNPADPAETHFRLGRALHRAGDPGARRQVLQALEYAPRYRDALALLRAIARPAAATNSPALP